MELEHLGAAMSGYSIMNLAFPFLVFLKAFLLQAVKEILRCRVTSYIHALPVVLAGMAASSAFLIFVHLSPSSSLLSLWSSPTLGGILLPTLCETVVLRKLHDISLWRSLLVALLLNIAYVVTWWILSVLLLGTLM